MNKAQCLKVIMGVSRVHSAEHRKSIEVCDVKKDQIKPKVP